MSYSLKEAQKLSAEKIKSALNKGGLDDVLPYLLKQEGKGVRSRLLITSALDENNSVSEDAIFAAAAIEILHGATLVHDDVIDDAPIRRGVQTLHKRFDVKTAIIAGDCMLSISLSLLSELDANRLERAKEYKPVAPFINRALASICKGEYLQHKNNGNFELNIHKYLRIISGKTAALFYVSAFGGALLSDETNEDAVNIGRFGRILGMMFQIADDCKDYSWTQNAAKKTVSADVKSGIATLPLICAAVKKPVLRVFAREVMQGLRDAHEFAKTVIENDGVKAARAAISKYETNARAVIKNIKQPKQEKLLKLLEIIE